MQHDHPGAQGSIPHSDDGPSPAFAQAQAGLRADVERIEREEAAHPLRAARLIRDARFAWADRYAGIEAGQPAPTAAAARRSLDFLERARTT